MTANIDELLGAVAMMQSQTTDMSVQETNDVFLERCHESDIPVNAIDLNEDELGALLLHKNPPSLACAVLATLEACTDRRQERGRTDLDAKVKSLQARWFGQVTNKDTTVPDIWRGHIIEIDEINYLVLSIFKLSYNKWRWIQSTP